LESEEPSNTWREPELLAKLKEWSRTAREEVAFEKFDIDLEMIGIITGDGVA